MATKEMRSVIQTKSRICMNNNMKAFQCRLLMHKHFKEQPFCVLLKNHSIYVELESEYFHSKKFSDISCISKNLKQYHSEIIMK